jgi:hypothetical protein
MWGVLINETMGLSFVSPAQSFSDLRPVGIMTILYSLLFNFFIYNLNQQSEFTFYKLMLWLLQCLDGESSRGESPVPQNYKCVVTRWQWYYNKKQHKNSQITQNNTLISSAELTAIFYCLICDSPNLEDQVPVFIPPKNRVAQLYPRALSSLFIAS